MKVKDLVRELSRWDGDAPVLLVVEDQPFQVYDVKRTETALITRDMGGTDFFDECEYCGCVMEGHRHLTPEVSLTLVGERLKNAGV